MIRAIRHRAPVGILPLLLFDIAILFACFYAAAEILYLPSGWSYLFFEGGITLVAIAIAMIVAAMYFFDMYTDPRVSSRIVLVQQLCQALGVAIIAQTVAIYVFRDWTVPHIMMIYSAGLALAGLLAWRLAFGALLGRVGGQTKLLFLGRNDAASAIATEIARNPKSGYRVVGFLEDDFRNLAEVVEAQKPSLLVVGLQERRAAMPVGELVALRLAGLQIEEAGTTFETVYGRVRLADLSDREILFSRSLVPPAGSRGLDRAFSFCIAAVALLLLSPFLLVMALALKLTTRESVLVALTRTGLDGKQFSMYRFRRGLRPFQALPELWNVLRGDMAFVGPAPEDAEAATLTGPLPFYEYRLTVPPGLTGWAQIHGAHNDRELMLEYDLYYIKHMSFALNLYILTHSLKATAKA